MSKNKAQKKLNGFQLFLISFSLSLFFTALTEFLKRRQQNKPH